MTPADQDCIFCKIGSHKSPATIISENDTVFTIRDLHPAAPSHALVIPKMHIVSLNDLNEENSRVLADLTLMARDVAKILKVDKTGFRLVINSGPDAGQSVFHLHAHLLGGRDFSWPPG
jgi:histidine triad (HIT) family protein